MPENSFTKDEYDSFYLQQAKDDLHNCPWRDVDKESYFDAMKSDEADFAKSEEGQKALRAIIAFGDGHGE